MQQAPISRKSQFLSAVTVTLLAGAFGFGAGWLMAQLAPSDEFFWASLVVAPLWLLLEFFFEGVTVFLGHRSRAAHLASMIAVLAGFYLAWFWLRGLAP